MVEGLGSQWPSGIDDEVLMTNAKSIEEIESRTRLDDF
jgi:hypothetical protein